MNAEWEAVRKRPVRMRTLEKRNRLLSDFLREHGLGEPKSVEYSPLVGCVKALCFKNVEAQIARAGGGLESGWAFRETLDVSMHTIAHAIWITPQGRRMDITPWAFPPERRVLFLPDARVAAKRGYTAGHRTVYATDPRVRAAELYELELDRIFDEFFVSMDAEYDIPGARFWEAAERVGLPLDVAREVVEWRMARGGHG
jgi:hypothetical protein